MKEIQIDVSNCYCLFGCYRLIDEARDAFHCLKLNPKLEKLVIVGTKSKEERRTITDIVVRSLLDTAEDVTLLNKEFYPDGWGNRLGEFRDGVRPKLHFPKFEVIERSRFSLDDYDVEGGLEDEEVDLYNLVMEKKGGKIDDEMILKGSGTTLEDWQRLCDRGNNSVKGKIRERYRSSSRKSYRQDSCMNAPASSATHRAIQSTTVGEVSSGKRQLGEIQLELGTCLKLLGLKMVADIKVEELELGIAFGIKHLEVRRIL
ncbi:uncharacterized protein MYCFIDRAFT_174383 [Pseudocercospora fijiensis CIRAD86]|uniref:Uncharacterized protein n=1 Tax=Pseudocercospora fijiensis (strain CIRAD86) TaxID=383855 RepID=M3B0A3_PSEFD|nr:uncharacterized protein MYCFIDRAFT_174383 [Pseudocercospora fijiensis CIRAD86]EME82857.1 hypothetical protein MYCFIDRAFT_174383 [Pseudocercospora fijiensis CIRAD86]